MTPAIRVTALSKTFRKGLQHTKALDGVDLLVRPGEMVALIGASGSGKSTFIRHLAGLIQADHVGSCCVEVLGDTVQECGRISANVVRTRRKIGVIFQQFNLVSRLTVLTNVLMTGLLGRVPRWRGTLGLFSRDEKRTAMRALHRVGIAGTALQRASTLSGGQQQRAAIARVLVQGAEIVLADEPIASLDPASAKRVMETLSTVNREEGITVVVSLHQVEYARRFCPRTVAMRDGRVVYDGSSEALTTQFLRDIYGEASEELVLPDAGQGEILVDAPMQPVPATAPAAALA